MHVNYVTVSDFVDGKNLSDMLIANGLARPYNGGAKSSWCN